MAEMGMTKAQREALTFLSLQDRPDEGGAVLWKFLAEGHTRKVLAVLLKRGQVEWSSSYSITTAATVTEFLREQETTSYVRITEAGRRALTETEKD